MVGNFSNEDEKHQFYKILDEPINNVKIQLIGFVNRNKLYKYYQNADFTIIPAVWDEPFSRVPLESMACGTPCIATRSTGINDLINAKAPILLIDKNNAESLGETLQPFYKLGTKYTNLCVKGKKFIQSKYTFNHYMNNVVRELFTK